MTPEQFCYWLQGFAEITQTDQCFSGPQPHEWKIITDHLNLVFKKETPNYNITPVFGPKVDPNRWWDAPPQITC